MKKILSSLCAASFALFISLTVFPSFSAQAASNNIALDGYAEVDSVHRQYPEHVGSNLNDGNLSTRWQSNAAMKSYDPCIGGIFWHEYYTIDSIIIYWETSRPLETGYTIEVSDDCGYTWRRANFTVSARVEIPNGDKSIYKDEITLVDCPEVNAVRAVCTQGAPFDDGTGAKDAASIFEFEVYGTYVKSAKPSFSGLKNISYDADVEVDSVNVEYPQYKANLLNDANYSTRWQSNAAMTVVDPCWVEMYWDMTYEIKAIGIYWENSRPDLDGYSIEYSDDGGRTWKSHGFRFDMRLKELSVIKPDGSGTETQHLDSFYANSKVYANAIRICCSLGQEWDGYGTRKGQASIFELEVYATPNSGVPNEEDEVSSNVSSNIPSANVSSNIISSETPSVDVTSSDTVTSDAVSSDTVTSVDSDEEASSTVNTSSATASENSQTVSEGAVNGNGTDTFAIVAIVLLSAALVAAVVIIILVIKKTSC